MKEKNLKKIIGYRFFKENPQNSKECQNYFIFVLKDKKKYDVLEINSDIADNYGNTFINKNLDCYSIIETIIKINLKIK